MKTENIKSIVLPILEARNLFLVDIQISKDNHIEIFIDSYQGVNIQSCIEISRETETHLNRDEEDFELTVSSAGIGYPFKVEEQYQKNLGQTIEIKFKDNKKLTARLKAFTPEILTVEYEEKIIPEGGKKKQLITTERNISREEIKEVRDVVVF